MFLNIFSEPKKLIVILNFMILGPFTLFKFWIFRILRDLDLPKSCCLNFSGWKLLFLWPSQLSKIEKEKLPKKCLKIFSKFFVVFYSFREKSNSIFHNTTFFSKPAMNISCFPFCFLIENLTSESFFSLNFFWMVRVVSHQNFLELWNRKMTLISGKGKIKVKNDLNEPFVSWKEWAKWFFCFF